MWGIYIYMIMLIYTFFCVTPATLSVCFGLQMELIGRFLRVVQRSGLIGSRRATRGVQQQHHFASDLRYSQDMTVSGICVKEWTSWCRFGSRFHEMDMNLGMNQLMLQFIVKYVTIICVFKQVEKLWIDKNHLYLEWRSLWEKGCPRQTRFLSMFPSLTFGTRKHLKGVDKFPQTNPPWNYYPEEMPFPNTGCLLTILQMWGLHHQVSMHHDTRLEGSFCPAQCAAAAEWTWRALWLAAGTDIKGFTHDFSVNSWLHWIVTGPIYWWG